MGARSMSKQTYACSRWWTPQALVRQSHDCPRFNREAAHALEFPYVVRCQLCTVSFSRCGYHEIVRPDDPSAFLEIGSEQKDLSNTVEQAAYIVRVKGLTRREEEILAMLLDDRTVASIENALYISSSTAKTHIQHIYKKLDVHSKQELIEVCTFL